MEILVFCLVNTRQQIMWSHELLAQLTNDSLVNAKLVLRVDKEKITLKWYNSDEITEIKRRQAASKAETETEEPASWNHLVTIIP